MKIGTKQFSYIDMGEGYLPDGITSQDGTSKEKKEENNRKEEEKRSPEEENTWKARVAGPAKGYKFPRGT